MKINLSKHPRKTMLNCLNKIHSAHSCMYNHLDSSNEVFNQYVDNATDNSTMK